jgi:hypothetical protein
MPILRRHIDNNFNFPEELDYSFNASSFICGDGYKNGLNHSFIGSTIDVELLLPLFKRFRDQKLLILNIVDTERFHFSCISEKFQKFMFKYCRYTRSHSLRLILDSVNLILKDPKVKSFNALMLGHYLKARPSYYNNSRDIVPLSGASEALIGYTFRSLADFTAAIGTNRGIYINYIYMITSPGNHNAVVNRYDVVLYKQMTKLLNNKKYAEAQRILYFPR